MATYTLPNTVSGGSITVQGSSLADAQQNAASQTGASLSQQIGGGTFGANTFGGGSVPSPGQVAAPMALTPTAQQYGNAIQQAVAALNSSDLKAFNEQVRQWNLQFGFSQDQFQEAIRQYNQNFGITQAGVTGTYQGAPTLQAQNQAANFLGTYQGQQTLQAQLQAFNEQQALAQMYGQGYANFGQVPAGQQTLAAQLQAFNEQQALAQMYGQGYANFGQVAPGQQTLAAQQQAYTQAYNLAALAASQQANPFRQQQIYQQANQILGGRGVAGFSAPQAVGGVGTAGGNQQGGLGYLNQIIADIQNPTPNQTSADQFINATPTPNKIDSASFLQANPSTQNIVLQAMQEKYGIDPNDALNQIKNTLPQFQAPTAVGTVKR